MDFITNILEQIKDAPPILQFAGIWLISVIPFLEAYIAVPIGIAVSLSFWMTIAVAIIGNWLSVALVVLVSERGQKWLQRRRAAKHNSGASSKRMQRASDLFNKYGVPGVAFIGPLLIGNHIGAFISIMSGASKRYVLLWQTISIIVWALGTGILVALGVDLINR